MKIIKNGTIIGEDVLQGDLAIKDGKIFKIASFIQEGPDDEIIDAEGCYIFPGFIDPHTHFDMTNALTTTADDYDSGSEKAILGGTTTVINFASPKPGEKKALHQAFSRELAKAQGKSSCHFKFHMELLEYSHDIEEEILQMSELGVSSFKIYMAYGFAVEDKDIYRILEAVKKTGGLMEAHCENGQLIQEKTKDILHLGIKSPQGHPLTRPPEVEAEAINRLANIGRLMDYPIHIVHLSSKLGLEEARYQRSIGTKLTLETCPQYLLLDESKYFLPEEGLKYIMSPPLRKKEDQEALLDAIEKGEIQTLATDHCSYRFDRQKIWGKDDFTKTPGGAPGVGERVTLAYSTLLDTGRISPQEFVQFLSTNAAKLYGIYPQKGVLAEGSQGDIVIYEKQGFFVISQPPMDDPMDYNTYEGLETKGRVRDVFLSGKHVVKNGILIEKGLGEYVK